MDQADIINIMQQYLDENRGSTLEHMIVLKAMAEIKMHRELGDAPIQSLVLRNADLAAENRKLREENGWFQFFVGARSNHVGE